MWSRPLACLFCCAALPLFGQFSSGAGGSGTGAGRMNSARTQSSPTFIPGQVFLEDGGAISSPITIVGGCRGSMQLLGYTDLKGRFSFDIKSGNSLQDAASSGSRSASAI